MSHQVHPQETRCCEANSPRKVVDEKYCSDSQTVLTVWKKSLLFGSEGFTVYDSHGDLIFRVDCYGNSAAFDEVVLMDASGMPLLTLRRKLPSLHNRWEGFSGDNVEGQKPLFTVRKSSILPSTWSPVDVFFMSPGLYWRQCADYHVEGSFSHNCCSIYTASSPRRTAAEVKKKCGPPGTVLKDVFSLTIEAGFDKAFIMGVLVILDQISGSGEFKKFVDELRGSEEDVQYPVSKSDEPRLAKSRSAENLNKVESLDRTVSKFCIPVGFGPASLAPKAKTPKSTFHLPLLPL